MNKLLRCIIVFAFIVVLSMLLVKLQYKVFRVEDYFNIAFLNTRLFDLYGINRFNIILVMNYSLFTGASLYCFLFLSKVLNKDYLPLILYRFSKRSNLFNFYIQRIAIISLTLLGIKTITFMLITPLFFNVTPVSFASLFPYFIKIFIVDYLLGLLILNISLKNHGGYVVTKIIILLQFIIVIDSLLDSVDILSYTTDNIANMMGLMLILSFIALSHLLLKKKIRLLEL